MHPPTIRDARLEGLFDALTNGAHSATPPSAHLVLESVYRHPRPKICLEKLASSKHGLSSVYHAIMSNLTSAFLNSHIAPLILTLRSAERAGGDGHDVDQIITRIVEVPAFLEALSKAFCAEELNEDGQHAFAWILLRLASLPHPQCHHYHTLAQDNDITARFLASTIYDVRELGYKLKRILDARDTSLGDTHPGPGGRHDNDHRDFRSIRITPTPDEIMSRETPFLRTADQIAALPTEERAAAHLDNQFRLCREDMIHDLRERVQAARDGAGGSSNAFIFDDVQLVDVFSGSGGATDSPRWGILLRMQPGADLWFFQQAKPKKRKQYLVDHSELIQEGSMSALMVDGTVVAVLRVCRNVDKLSKTPPEFTLLLDDDSCAVDLLCKLRTRRGKLVLSDVSSSSRESILEALQRGTPPPIVTDLALWDSGATLKSLSNFPQSVISALRNNPTLDFGDQNVSPSPIKLDGAEAQSIVSCLTNSVSLVQNPPGTNGPLVASILTKIVNDFTTENIMVCCHSDRALSELLDTLVALDISLDRVKGLEDNSSMRGSAINNSRSTNAQPTQRKTTSAAFFEDLRTAFRGYMQLTVTHQEFLEHLEFTNHEFYQALQVPSNAQKTGKRGRGVNRFYLVDRWATGQDAGVLRDAPNVQDKPEIWDMSTSERSSRLDGWRAAIVKEHAERFLKIASAYIGSESLARAAQGPHMTDPPSKRIVAYTAADATKNSETSQAPSPDTVIVLEADRFLESQIFGLLGETTHRLVLIGDHKQLRPRISNRALSVEGHQGYDFDRTLFERLILHDYPHTVLTKQHHIRPQLSSYLRDLAYPDLIDASSTQGRQDTVGLADSLVFIAHSGPEEGHERTASVRNGDQTQSMLEVCMLVKTLRYLAQNGHSLDGVVVLTQSVVQLHRLQQALSQEADLQPVVSAGDSLSLLRAGLLSQGPAKPAKSKKCVNLRTIDDCRGQYNIALVSLAGSDYAHGVGSMGCPERLNAIFSCSREALIMFGNPETVGNAEDGGELWTRFLSKMWSERHVYDGLPVRCQRHPDQTTIIKRPEDFEECCPQGGCCLPCDVLLTCGVHRCRLKCHSVEEHMKAVCTAAVRTRCPRGHLRTYKCHRGAPPSCVKCDKRFQVRAQGDKEGRSGPQALREPVTAINKPSEQSQLPSIPPPVPPKDYEIESDENGGSETYTSFTSTTSESYPFSRSVSPTLSHPSVMALDPGVLYRTSSPTPSSTTNETTSPLPPSKAEQEWRRQKDADGANNASIDTLMEMTGLEKVKLQLLHIKAVVDTMQRQEVSMSDEQFNIVLRGNPGTGKTTIARIYARFLASMRILSRPNFFETTGSRLASDGVSSVKQEIEDLKDSGGGAFFVDEAYQLTSPQNHGGGQVLDFLLGEMEKHKGRIVFIFAGYNRQMEKFFEHNPGLASRVPYSLHFADYTDAELLHMLGNLVSKRYSGKMKVEGGLYGLYMRIAVRRLGRGRGREGFGNARALRNMLARITERQATRLTEERKNGATPDDFSFTKEDIIGPDPSKAILDSAACKQLHRLTGLVEVKQSIRNLFDLIAENYKRELAEKQPVQMSLNRVFLGNPGTGKTTVAKLYGQILADIGLLSSGEVILKNPADFIGGALGESERNTKGILSATAGKVLVIDEAYSLYGGGKQGDSYKTAVIDAIVSEVQSVPGEDRCVLMCGYESQMREMFQNVNPGLSRRFAIEDAFYFADFTDSQLLEILDLKLQDQDLAATPEAKAFAIDMLGRARNRPHFGNGGEVENMLSKAKNNHRSRQSKLSAAQRYEVVFEPIDFDPNFDRAEKSDATLKKLFEDLVGCERIVEKLQHYQHVVRVAKKRGGDVRKIWAGIPTTFVFRGPPGTGKTTVARRMGQVYYDMGFLSSPEVVECSTSDLVGQHVGHTGPKTRELFGRALGKVLFIDEAYRLSEGSFAKEAVDELVGLLSRESGAKLVVVIAGYASEMNSFLTINPGLASRFPEKIDFQHVTPEHGLEILKLSLAQDDVECKALSAPRSKEYKQMASLVAQLSLLDSWGNARDIKTLSKQMVGLAFKHASDVAPGSKLSLPGAAAVSCIAAMLQDRIASAKNLSSRSAAKDALPEQYLGPQEMTMPKITQSRTTRVAVTKTRPTGPQRGSSPKDGRDPGVSDAVWSQLQTDKQATQEAARGLEEQLRRVTEDLRGARDEERRFLELRRKKMLEEKRKEGRIQQKIKEMGLCCAGYAWTKQAGGYRCEGGSHWVSNSDLGL